jgi:glucose-6-phosphate dehydrogenase assembly protein OpcA
MTRADGFPVPADASAIERALRELWTPAAEGELVVRAQAATLLIYTTSTDRRRLDRTIDQVMRQFPGRAILIDAAGDHGEPGLEAWISARCHPGLGGHVCGEQITVAAAGEPAETLPSLVAGLRPPDVPAFLWWDAPIPERGGLLLALADEVERLIVDSRAYPPADRALALLADLSGGPLEAAVGDLSWTGTAPWRELVAQFFDAPATRGYLRAVDRVEISYAGPGARAEALLMAGWLVSRLGWEVEGRGVDAGQSAQSTWTLRRAGAGSVAVTLAEVEPGGGAEGLAAVRLTAGAADFGVEWLASERCARIITRTPGEEPRQRAVVMAASGEARLICQEMSLVGRDPVFDAALAAAARLGT